MKELILIIFIVICGGCYGEELSSTIQYNNTNLIENYQNDTFNFFVSLYRAVAHHSNANFVMSLHSVWIMLAAIAEGSDQETQQQLFKLLRLPDDLYKRQKYYEIITSRVTPDYGVSLIETRTLFVDENVRINPAWWNLVSRNSFLNVITAPIQNNPVFTVNWIRRQTASNKPRIDLSGNSILLDTIDYNGLWATAFEGASTETSPFYDQEGEEIGAVDLMRMKRKARFGYVENLKAKVLEIPVGTDSRYRMLFVLIFDKIDIKSVIKTIRNDIISDMFRSLNDTNVPIDIAIPRFKITSEIDMREILTDMGVTNLWTNPEATKHISTPPAFPTSYVQRATLTINKYGLAPPHIEEIPEPEKRSGLDPNLTPDFIANQPVLFGLFDVETYTPLIVAGISQPTISKYGTTYIRNI